MNQPHINHLTLSTGHNAYTSRADVPREVITNLTPWLRSSVNTGKAHPLPAASVSHFSARLDEQAGGLLVTVYAPAEPYQEGERFNGETMPIVTFGVAGCDDDPLWSRLVGGEPMKPKAPWCAVSLHTGLMLYMLDAAWMGDFERCVAWAWLEMMPIPFRVTKVQEAVNAMLATAAKAAHDMRPQVVQTHSWHPQQVDTAVRLMSPEFCALLKMKAALNRPKSVIERQAQLSV